MGLVVHQNITIQQLRVEGITNSSVLQIGSAGIIKPLSNIYNTGGFTGPAPQIGAAAAATSQQFLVPLPAPR